MSNRSPKVLWPIDYSLMLYDYSSMTGFPFFNRARLKFQVFALCDMKMAAQESCSVGQKMSYRFSFR